MKRIIAVILILITIIGCSKKTEEKILVEENVCVLQTSMGKMVFRFFEGEAPKTAAHIQQLVEDGFYNGRDFYRVVKGHVIQTGGDEGEETITDEFNKHQHLIGSVGLAHGRDPNSGGSAIYICLTPRPHLNGTFTVFGQLIEGMDILENIGNVEVNEDFIGRIAFHKPKVLVVIEKATIEKRELEPYVEIHE